jgi:hypothetical protein
MKGSINRYSFVYAQILSMFSITLLLLFSFNYLCSVFASTEKRSDDDDKDCGIC